MLAVINEHMNHLVRRKLKLPSTKLLLRLVAETSTFFCIHIFTAIDCWLWKLCRVVCISILKQKSTLWVLELRILVNGILIIGKWKFAILCNRMTQLALSVPMAGTESLSAHRRPLARLPAEVRVGRVAGGGRPAPHDSRPSAKSATHNTLPDRPGQPGPTRTFFKCLARPAHLSGSGF